MPIRKITNEMDQMAADLKARGLEWEIVNSGRSWENRDVWKRLIRMISNNGDMPQ